jgi:hypothetical protein
MPLAFTAEQIIDFMHKNPKEARKRGLNVYSATSLQAVSGRDKSGNMINATYEYPLFGLKIDERLDIFRFCSAVFGIVTSRMQRISGLEWHIIPNSKDEDRIADSLKDAKAIYSEYAPLIEDGNIGAALIVRKMLNFVKGYLDEVLDDLSNFNTALLRWKRRINAKNEDKASEIEDWLAEPGLGTDIGDFLKMSVADLMIHGGMGVYKEVNDNKLLENFYLLPGGTVFPMRNRYVGGINAYLQLIDVEEAKIYFQDEISYSKYVPTSARSHGLIPLEALVNKIAESLLFDKRSAEQADGTRPPEKLIVFGDNAPFGSFDEEVNLPINKDEQGRIETIINESRKEAIRTLSGVGTPISVDLSRENLFQYQMERQKQIREEVGLVYNASNVEMNLTGSDDTSGRATSETQERLDKQRGIYPVILLLQRFFDKDILPFRYGTGYKLEFSGGTNEFEQIRLVKEKMQSGVFPVNEIRTEDLGKEPFEGEEYDKPKGGGQMGDSMNPMNILQQGE